MPFVTAGEVGVEYLVTGTGRPVSVFAHGLGGSIPETRPLGSGVAGSRVFLHFRGHGRSSDPDTDWSYADLAAELRAVADATGATQALGVSMGAAALCRLLADTPDRFARLVFFLPAVLDEPRGGDARVRAVESGDAAAIEEAVRQELLAHLRHEPEVETYVRRRVAALQTPGVARALRLTRSLVAVPDPACLARVTAPALVLAAEDDPLHPESVARALAAALPRSELHIYPGRGLLWTHREDLRRRISRFLGPQAPLPAAPPR